MSAIPNKDQVRVLIDRVFVNGVPHNVALGIELVDFEPEFLELRLPYSDKIVGNPETGGIHGGAVTTLMDAGCGGAVMIRLGKVRGNKMVDMQLSNTKLVKRGVNMIMAELDVDEATAQELLEKFGSVRQAIDSTRT